MGFRELDIKHSYDSEEDNILEKFYIPVLSKSRSYKRLAGFFSSSTLAVVSRGMSEFIINGGKMELITSSRISKKDITVINQGIEDREKCIEKSILADLTTMEDQFKDHIKVLGWMVKNNNLDIKIAIINDMNGNLLDSESIDRMGIFHQKVGIFEDIEGNTISFSGSVNETANAWINNIEQFNVFCSWIEGDKKYNSEAIRKFNKYWSGNTKRVKIIDVPYAVRNHLIQEAPADDEELIKILKNISHIKKKKKLRDYQNDAINKWLTNYCGILQLATGTGKTFTALCAIEKFCKIKKNTAIIIACPYQHLVEQWNEVMINDFDINPILAYSKVDWEPTFNKEALLVNMKMKDSLFVVTTYDTLRTKKFQSILAKINVNVLFVADEAHHLGSEVSKELLPSTPFRMGLTATPERYMDTEGTDTVINYFGGIITKLELKDAIEKGYLNEYLYKPIMVYLNDYEMEYYIELTNKITKLWFTLKNKYNKEEILNKYYIERANILNTASNKIDIFNQLIDKEIEIAPISHTLVYCNDMNQLEKVTKLLFNKGIITARITAHEDDPKIRKQVLKDFKNGTIQVIVAIDCLDEGIDIPSARLAFILASSCNPRQFIQRRGRLLRKLSIEGKIVDKLVKIYDLITVPPVSNNVDNNIEHKILSRELKRFEEFCNTAKNNYQAKNELLKYLHDYVV